VVSDAESSVPTTATLGYGAITVGSRTDSLTIRASATDQNAASSTSGSGG